MSKPNIDGLGVCAELTLHEMALRKAQHEIDALKAENARLRNENAVLRAREIIHPDQERRILCKSPMASVTESFGSHGIQG